MSATGKAKQYKKELIAAFVLGIILLFVVNNWTTQGVYDIVSCTYNQNDCPGCGEDADWNGDCTYEIKNECCFNVDVCGGQRVDNFEDCYHYYCTDSNKYCGVVDEEYNQDAGTYKYICGCKVVEDYKGTY